MRKEEEIHRKDCNNHKKCINKNFKIMTIIWKNSKTHWNSMNKDIKQNKTYTT